MLSGLIPAAAFFGTLAVVGSSSAAAVPSRPLSAWGTISLEEFHAAMTGTPSVLHDDVQGIPASVAWAVGLSQLAAGVAVSWPCCNPKRRQLADECLGTQVVFKQGATASYDSE